jgi:hypothetical protein
VTTPDETKPPIQDLIDAAPEVEEEDDLELVQIPTLDPRALDGPAGDFVSAVCEYSEAAPVAVLATYLTSFGIALGSKCHIWVGDTKHYARIMSVIVAQSARGRKGTSVSPVRRLLEESLNYTGVTPGCPTVGMHITDGPASTAEGLIYAVRDAGKKLNKDGEPEDNGIEDKRLLIFEGEFGGVMKASKRDGNTITTAVRSAWDHGNLAPLTKTSPISATEAHIGIVGHITRQELEQQLEAVDLFNGFYNRFLWVHAHRAKQVPWPQRTEDHIFRPLVQRFVRALDSSIDRMTMTPTAQRLWVEGLYPVLSVDLPGAYGNVCARAEAQVIRLAMIYAKLDGVSIIEVDHFERAYAFWQYCQASAKMIFGGGTVDPDETKLLDALKSGPKTNTSIRHDVFNNHASKETLAKLLMKLKLQGKIVDEQRKGKGRPLTTWRLVS